MNRAEFMAALEAQLRDITTEERDEALKFYNEYLDEAGPENEAAVLAELGSPQKVACIIRANCGFGVPAVRDAAEKSTAPEKPEQAPVPELTLDGPDWQASQVSAQETERSWAEGQRADEEAPDGFPNAQAADGAQHGPAYAYSYRQDGAQRENGGRSASNRTLWVILLILTCPIWIGLIGGLFGGVVGIVGGLCGIAFAGFATMIAGVAAFGGGRDKVLDCGQFELDSVDASGPPNTITIKATALPYSAQIRQTEKSKAWEAYTLSGIANEMAAANGMTCMFLANSDPSYGRVEQYKQSDIAFLSKLCHEAGISLKATNNLIVLFDQEDYEKKSPVLTIVRGSGSYTKHKLNAGTAGTQYASCRVSYTDPGTGKCIEATVKVEDYNDKAKNNQQLEITAKVASVAEAKTKAEKYLRLHNKYAKTATFTLPGNPDIVAGVTAKLTGWGAWDGKYIVEQAAHSVGSSGYTTQVKLRKTLEGY